MPEHFQKLGDGFWHIQGQFRLFGLVDIGTQCSLVEMPSGDLVFLDSYRITGPAMAEVHRLTEGGARVAAILNLHPFHTAHCSWMHARFPAAKLYGTSRHKRQAPGLPWEQAAIESAEAQERFADALEFSAPRGMPLVNEDESVHCASVLAYHRPSGTVHVDDTLMRFTLPSLLSKLPMSGRVDFHPTLGKALAKEAGAATAFHEWATEIGTEWHEARNIAFAHNSVMKTNGQFPELVGAALGRAMPVLDKHCAKYG